MQPLTLFVLFTSNTYIFSLVAVHVARGEVLKAAAFADEGFHLRGEVDGAIVAPSHVEGGDANVISHCHEQVLLLVVKDEGEHATKLGREVDAGPVLGIEGENDLAVATRLGSVGRLEVPVQLLVVVNLAVGGNDNVAVRADERLLAGLGVHDGEALVADTVRKRTTGALILRNEFVSRPVRTAMAELGRAFDEMSTKFGLGEGRAENCEDPTHVGGKPGRRFVCDYLRR